MNVTVENLEEKNMARLTIEVPAEDLEKALNAVYMKQKNSISIPGFRKGKVPRAVVERMYGAEIFYEDAANDLLQQTYGDAADQSGADIVSRPQVDIVQLEKGKPFIYTADVAVKPEVQLGQYKGVEVTMEPVEVTEQEVQSELEMEQGKNARLVSTTDHAVEMGDTAVIDFEGFVDGVAFDGGKGENYSLEIGSHSFIDTFEDQLVGTNIGDELDVEVTFPTPYQDANLAGKPATFHVAIKDIQVKELPDLDDEFAQDVSEYDTLEEYKKSLENEIRNRKLDGVKRNQEDEAVQKIIEASSMDIPEAMIDTQCENMIDEFAQQIQQSGLTMEQYMQYSGMTVPKLREQIRPEAINRIQSSLVLEQIAKDEGIEISDDEFAEETAKMAESYGMPVEDLRGYMNEGDTSTMKKEMAIRKAIDLVMDNVVEVEAPAEEAEAAEDAKEAEIEADVVDFAPEDLK